jgi:hypothetical protein
MFTKFVDAGGFLWVQALVGVGLLIGALLGH